ncbi:hypothetical protein Taro_025870 [Colocasia esculenta]|uniref:Uncharacterized protein n=1 Tax=Colocasia esculenta TaxID=4460 RepID=A0A843VIU9_COLES|nr:hypothetical protein [Colocasia esculenta]
MPHAMVAADIVAAFAMTVAATIALLYSSVLSTAPPGICKKCKEIQRCVKDGDLEGGIAQKLC